MGSQTEIATRLVFPFFTQVRAVAANEWESGLESCVEASCTDESIKFVFLAAVRYDTLRGHLGNLTVDRSYARLAQSLKIANIGLEARFSQLII